MRLFLALSATLLTILSTVSAHADGFSDFSLVGDGHTITFALPTSYAAPVLIRAYNPFYVGSGTATVDGVSGNQVAATLFPFYVFPIAGEFHFTSSFGGINQIDLIGPNFVAYAPSTDPSVYLYINIIPGTYNLFEDDSSTGTPAIGTPFTLTITPEVSSVPEPSTLLLAATGLLGSALWLLYKRRPCMF